MKMHVTKEAAFCNVAGIVDNLNCNGDQRRALDGSIEVIGLSLGVYKKGKRYPHYKEIMQKMQQKDAAEAAKKAAQAKRLAEIAANPQRAKNRAKRARKN
jgi:hypothetical protein